MTADTRAACAALDAADLLAPLRRQFALDALDRDGVIYLDGNSLGVLPRATPERLRQVIEQEWGTGLIRSWNSAGWITLAQSVADRIAGLVGARGGEVFVGDSTSINLHKVLSAAVAIVQDGAAGSGGGTRRLVVSEATSFPSDLYIADSVARAAGFELRLVGADDIASRLDPRTAIVLLTHVNYRTGHLHDMAATTAAAHAAGALAVWDLSHSAGAVPVDLSGGSEGADFAVGCGYKYLNGGPGAPAFAWAHPRHVAWMDRTGWRPPLSGWFGHAAPFAFSTDYEPSGGMARLACGTPPVLSLAALACGVESVLAAEPLGGVAALHAKAAALTALFIELVESRCDGHGLTLATPREARRRGSQVAFAHPDHGYAIVQALIAEGVIGDFRAPDLLRFGFPPLYTRYVDVWDAVDRLRHVLARGTWQRPEFAVRHPVT